MRFDLRAFLGLVLACVAAAGILRAQPADPALESLINGFGASHSADDLKKATDALALEKGASDPQTLAMWLKLFANADAAAAAQPAAGGEAAELRGLVRDRVDPDFWLAAGGLYAGDARSEAKLAEQAGAAGCSTDRIGWLQFVTSAPRGTLAPADPTIPREVTVMVPQKLQIARAGAGISVGLDGQSAQLVAIPVEHGMFAGVEADWRIYADGVAAPQPVKMRLVPMGGMSEGFSRLADLLAQPAVLSASPDAAKGCVVEEDLTIFETDVPAGQPWMAKNSPKYKVLWQGTVKQPVN